MISCKGLIKWEVIVNKHTETFAREYARVKMVKISPIFVEKLANS